MLTSQIENRNGIQLIHLSGALDSETHEQIEALLAPMVDQSDVRIVLDCAALSYVNSTSLALLGHCQRISLQNRSFMGIAGLNRRITKTIEMLGMSKLMPLYANVEQAMEAAAAM